MGLIYVQSGPLQLPRMENNSRYLNIRYQSFFQADGKLSNCAGWKQGILKLDILEASDSFSAGLLFMYWQPPNVPPWLDVLSGSAWPWRAEYTTGASDITGLEGEGQEVGLQ